MVGISALPAASVRTRVGATCALAILLVGTTLQAADTIRVVPLARDGSVLVSFDMAGGFTDEVRAAISSGLRTTMTYTVELRLQVPFWIDRTIASSVVSNSVQFDNLTRWHKVSRTIDGRIDEMKDTDDEAVVRSWLTSLHGLPLFETSKLEPNREYYVRVTARTQPSGGALPWGNGASGFAKFTFIP
jgi:hypothetical protein